MSKGKFLNIVDNKEKRKAKKQTEPFICEVEGCKRIFKKKGNLLRHQLRRHSLDHKEFECEFDGYIKEYERFLYDRSDYSNIYQIDGSMENYPVPVNYMYEFDSYFQNVDNNRPNYAIEHQIDGFGKDYSTLNTPNCYDGRYQNLMSSSNNDMQYGKLNHVKMPDHNSSLENALDLNSIDAFLLNKSINVMSVSVIERYLQDGNEHFEYNC